MKKLIALALSVVLAMGTFAGCGNTEATTVKVIEIDLTSEEYAFGVDKTQPELLESVNAFIAEIQANGKFDEICNNYFGDGTPVFAPAIEDRQSSKAYGFHFFQGLSDGKIVIYMVTHCLWCQKK